MDEEDILTPVGYREWKTPIAVVPNGNGKIRICGDYIKVKVNHLLKINQLVSFTSNK